MPPRKRAASPDTPVVRPRRSATKSAYFESDDETKPVRKRGRSSKASKDEVKDTPKVDGETAKKNWGWPRDGAAKDDGEIRPSAKKAKKQAPPSEEEDSEEEEFRIQVVLPPPIRPEGGVAYANGKLHPNTLLFLEDLKANNQRTWLKANDAEFRRAQTDFHTFVESLTPRIVSSVDDTIPDDLPVRDIAFRIYRDTRFSPDPTPYKPHFSAAWSRTGRKGPYAVYYLHCEPGKNPKGTKRRVKSDEFPGHCMLAGGLWCPDKDALARLRTSIDERPRRWRRALSDPVLVQEFLAPDGVERGPEAAVKLFAEHSSANALKTRPRDYRPDHRDIELLKLRNFVLSKKIPDEWFVEDDGGDKILRVFAAMAGFVSFLNSVVMPDPGLGEGEDDDGDEDANDDE